MIGVVGLGKIAGFHLQALEAIDSVDVVAGADRDPGAAARFRGRRVPVVRSPVELLALKPSTVIIATPSPSHYQTGQEVLDNADGLGRLIIEKPMAITLDDVMALLDAGTDRTRVSCLYHAAHAPDVVWAADRAGEWVSRFGRITRFEMSFADPYRELAETIRDRVYVNSWLDSGINALSVALRFVRLLRTESLVRRDVRGSAFAATVRFDSDGYTGTGLISTTWDVDSPAKHSTFWFASGARLDLDHQQVTAQLTTGGSIRESYQYGGDLPRLVAHYDAAFRALLVAGTGYFEDEATRLLHELLFQPAGSAMNPAGSGA